MVNIKINNIIDASNTGMQCVYSKTIADIPGIFITYLLVKYTNLSANFITWFSIIFAIISGYNALNGNIFYAAIFFYCSYLCDFIDGKLSRVTNTSSIKGKVLDLFADRLNLFIVGLSFISNFLYNGIIVEAILLCIFMLLFLIYDVFELSFALIKSRNDVNNKTVKKKRVKYFQEYGEIRKWVPSRVGLIMFIFFLAPLFSYMFFYIISILVILLRFSILMLQFVKLLKSI